MKKVSLVIPCYNEEKTVNALYDRVISVLKSLTDYQFEFLFINDGSKDLTLEKIKDMRKKDKRVCYVDLSRNFGKEKAMLAGFDYLTGDCCILIDADLQDPPELIHEMLDLWEEGYDDIYAKRQSRGKESWLRRKLSLGYYSLLQKMTKIEILPNVGDFRLLDKKCINVLRRMRESERYTKGLFCWIGFNKKEILFNRGDRFSGGSSWNYLSLFNLAIDGITSFTIVPLRIATLIGLLVSICAFSFMFYFLLKTIFWGDIVAGFPTLIIVILFMGGVQLISLGIIGEYLGRVFIETKRRPVYVVREYNEKII